MIDTRTLPQWLPVVAGMVLLLSGMQASAENAFRADLNRDGKIDGSDVTIINAEMGRDDCASSPCQADLNGDGRVTSEDLEIFRDEFKNSRISAGTPEAPAEQVMMAPAEEGLQPLPEDAAAGEPPAEAQALNARFEDNKNGTITDRETGLMWTKSADLCGDTLLFHQALDYIGAMNRGEHPNFGHTDWRLPTLDELRSLLDCTKLNRPGAALPEGHPFDNLQSFSYNKTSYLSNTEYAGFFSLYCRLVGHNVDSCFGHVWAVRGRQVKSRLE